MADWDSIWAGIGQLGKTKSSIGDRYARMGGAFAPAYDAVSKWRDRKHETSLEGSRQRHDAGDPMRRAEAAIYEAKGIAPLKREEREMDLDLWTQMEDYKADAEARATSGETMDPSEAWGRAWAYATSGHHDALDIESGMFPEEFWSSAGEDAPRIAATIWRQFNSFIPIFQGNLTADQYADIIQSLRDYLDTYAEGWDSLQPEDTSSPTEDVGVGYRGFAPTLASAANPVNVVKTTGNTLADIAQRAAQGLSKIGTGSKVTQPESVAIGRIDDALVTLRGKLTDAEKKELRDARAAMRESEGEEAGAVTGAIAAVRALLEKYAE